MGFIRFIVCPLYEAFTRLIIGAKESMDCLVANTAEIARRQEANDSSVFVDIPISKHNNEKPHPSCTAEIIKKQYAIESSAYQNFAYLDTLVSDGMPAVAGMPEITAAIEESGDEDDLAELPETTERPPNKRSSRQSQHFLSDLIDDEGETDAAGGVEGRGVGDVDGETSSASPTSQAWVEGDGEGAAASANPAEEGVEGDAAGDWGARRRSSAFEEESFPAQGGTERISSSQEGNVRSSLHQLTLEPTEDSTPATNLP